MALNTIEKAILFFSGSENCGEIVKRLYLQNKLGLDAVGVMRVVDAMRLIRYDIRARRTHPTLAAEEIICTYPFPLLSEKAHKERRIDQLALVPMKESPWRWQVRPLASERPSELSRWRRPLWLPLWDPHAPRLGR